MSKKAHETALPKLRFPEFRDAEAWKIFPLGELMDGVSKRNRDKKISRVFTNSAVSGIVDQRDFFDKDIATAGNTDNYSVIELGDYVYNPRISESAPVGPTSRNKLGRGIVSPLYTVFRFRNSNHNEFYDYYFGSTHWHNSLKAIGNSGARHDRMGISLTQLRLVKVPHPSLAEQHKIAAALSSLDALLTAQTDRLNALQAHKRGLMQDLFPAEGETVPKLRFPEFQNADEWKEKSLKEICRMQAGKFVSASNIQEHKQGNLYPCYGGNGLRGYTKTSTNEGKYSLVGRQGALCGNVMLATGKFHATEHAIVVTPKDNVGTDWLYYELIRLNLNQHATGQAQPGLSVDNLEKIKIGIPVTLREQQKIANCLSSLDNLITAQIQKAEALKLHKKGLMQALFPVKNE